MMDGRLKKMGKIIYVDFIAKKTIPQMIEELEDDYRTIEYIEGILNLEDPLSIQIYQVEKEKIKEEIDKLLARMEE